jgi:hypothetical protein
MVGAMTDGPRGTFDTDMARVRLVLIRELETISVYESLARDAQGAETKAFFEHLALEEKEHVAEATYLLRKLDAGQETSFQATYTEAHFQPAPGAPSQGEASAAPDASLPLPTDPRRLLYALPAPASPTAGAFTVGTLRRKP